MHNYEKIVFGASNKKDIEAIKDYSYAISVESKLPQAFMERGVRYSKLASIKKR